MSALDRLSIVALGDLVRDKKVSPVEITRHCLAQIAARNDAVNAFVTVAEEAALAEAEAAEAEIAGGNYRGPLHGIPIGHKDLIRTKGIRTTAGSRLHEDFVPDDDADAVGRLRAAGAVMLGKTNTHEFAYGPTTEISMFGPTRNPWNPDHISGGSSGGSGAAVAAGLCPGALGSDTGGSIRIPAACCGVVGMKSTYGRVSRRGVFPLCWSLDHLGPLTRTVADSALMLQSLAGFDPKDASTVDRPVPDFSAELNGGIDGLRIGIARKYFFEFAQDDVERAALDAIEVLKKLGAAVVEVEIADVDKAAAAAMVIYLSEATAYHGDDIALSPSPYSPEVQAFLELGNFVLAKDYLQAQRFRTLLGQVMVDLFDTVDVLVTPTLPVTATPIGQETTPIKGVDDGVFGALLRNTEPFNLVGLPCLVVPCGFSAGGMPISLQFVGQPFAEAALLRAGQAYESNTDWHLQVPAIA